MAPFAEPAMLIDEQTIVTARKRVLDDFTAADENSPQITESRRFAR